CLRKKTRLLLNNNVHVTKMLLRRGANPNLANDEGLTPLHLFYMRRNYYDISQVELFFKICDEVNQPVQVDECNGSRDRYYNSWWILGDARLRADRRLAQYSVRQFAPTAAASWFSLG
ncbi:unnamed protein product, partial [Trichogramma brassicae]